MVALLIEKLKIFQNKIRNLVYPENFQTSTFVFALLPENMKINLAKLGFNSLIPGGNKKVTHT